MDSPHLEDALHRACTHADLAQVQLLVEQGVDINKIIGPPSQLDYSINHATKTGSVALVRFLLDHGATVNAGALRTAAFEGNLPMLQLLLEPIKAQLASSGMSRKWRVDLAAILVGATRRGHSETAETLKVFRARVDDFDKAVDTGLLAACATGDMRSVEYFVEMGAANNTDALSTAAEYNQFEPLQYFLESLSFEPDELAGPLISAAASGHMPSILLLVEKGADDEGGALAKAAKYSHAPATQHLLESFQYSTDALSVALSAAALTGQTAIMDMLIQNGARGSSALHNTVQRSHLAATELLTERLSLSQAELSKALERAMFVWLRPPTALRRGMLSRNSSRSKEMIEAAPETGKPESQQTQEETRRRIVESLLDKGARLSVQCYCQLLEMMILVNNPFGIELLEQRVRFTTLDALPDEYLISLALYHQQTTMATHLLDLPLRPVEDSEEHTDVSSTRPVASTVGSWESRVFSPVPSPLILAVRSQNKRYCELLLGRKETNVNEWCSYRPNGRPLSYYGSDQKTHTPKDEQYDELCRTFGGQPIRDCALSMAVRVKDLSIVRMLIEHGADPWLNRQDISILKLAVEQDCLQHIVFFLDQFTAECNVDRIEWSGGRSMLHWAAAHGDGNLINLLCKKGATVDMTDGSHKTPLHVAVTTGNLDAVKALLWAGARTSLRDTSENLCADELATTLARQAFWSDPLRAVRFEISRLLDDWVKKHMDSLDASDIQREAWAAEQRPKHGDDLLPERDDLLDHLSDDDSAHWSEE